ncbi:hypothetical protein SAMN05444372_110143 [Flavobacterium micromati]|uniref:Uncharacterized protein n=1 Tax=Flavobacterium micromati TaxID=229205 RepID=A0A1M5N3Y0_9FLAO|nr:hypothetical protein SAMN05444372_110143 [Flavobacterium micromati]
MFYLSINFNLPLTVILVKLIKKAHLGDKLLLSNMAEKILIAKSDLKNLK